MSHRPLAALFAVSFFCLQALPGPALADNQMGYRMFTADQARALPRGGGKLGLNVGRAQQINSGGMTFELLRVNGVSPRSSGAQAGFKVGDQIIAVDGKVFPSVAAFAAYVGSMRASDSITIDYMPPSGGPQDAQRIKVTLAGADTSTSPAQPSKPADSTGLSTGAKIAIGVGAAALFGCYKMGCFSRGSRTGSTQQPIPQR